MDPSILAVIASTIASVGFTTLTYSQRETAILELIKQYVNSQKKSLEVHVRVGKNLEIDAVSLDGVDSLPGPTIFEIKNNIDNKLGLEAVLARIRQAARSLGARSAVVVVLSAIDKSITANLVRPAQAEETLREIQIWTIDEKLKNIAQSLAAEKVSLKFDSKDQSNSPKAVQKGMSNWKDTQKRLLAELRSAYINNDLVLFLGAGVSFDAGIPTWNSLLEDLLKIVVTNKAEAGYSPEDVDLVAQHLQKRHGASPLLMARYIRAGLGDKFAGELSKTLYKNIKNPLSEHAHLLNSIVRLCRPHRAGASLRAVVTYNFDDLLETRLAEMSIDHHSIYRESDVAKADELGICHVHGFLPRDDRKNELADSVLVFSEEGYHSVFMDPYLWSNIVQLNYLRQSTCLLVGLSAQDPNLRRLAEFMARKIGISKHYLILQREIMDPPATVAIADLYERIHHDLQEEVFHELGFNVLWVDSHADILRIIDYIHQGK